MQTFHIVNTSKIKVIENSFSVYIQNIIEGGGAGAVTIRICWLVYCLELVDQELD